MVPRLKKQRKTPKKGIITKNKAQQPPNPVSSDDFITDEDSEPTLRDVMAAIRTLSTWVAISEVRLASQP